MFHGKVKPNVVTTYIRHDIIYCRHTILSELLLSLVNSTSVGKGKFQRDLHYVRELGGKKYFTFLNVSFDPNIWISIKEFSIRTEIKKYTIKSIGYLFVAK